MPAADPNIKQIRLVSGTGATGEADDSPLQEGGEGQTRKRGGGRGGGRRANHKTFKVGSITKEGGGSTSPGTMTQLAASHVPGGGAAVATAVGVDSALTQKGAPVAASGGGAAATAAAAPAPVKVVLAAPKKGGSKVVLAATATPKLTGQALATNAASAAKTRKHKGGAARKIRVSMSSLSKKIHRAKTIRHKAKDDSLVEVKKALHKAGLIKAESKAPEPILRQMYADFLTLKSRAL